MKNILRIVGSVTLECGCVVGEYREANSDRGPVYIIDEKGPECSKKNHSVGKSIAMLKLCKNEDSDAQED